VAIGGCLLAIAIGSATAYGAATRAEYVAQVDPVCQTQTPPAQLAFANFFKQAGKHGPGALSHPKQVTGATRGPAMRLYRNLGNIYATATAQIALVPPAPEDAARVSAWLALRGTVAADLQKMAQTLKHNRLRHFDRATIQSGIDITAANNSVRDFGFQYCAPPGNQLILV
jgi:hypothetical protein